ncbi:Probable UDP-3-O-acyl-N-acetylglucosamine deacetylase 5, mitochondrial [Linum perenne]
MRMALTRGFFSWKSTGRFQQTLARSLELTGVGLHSGKSSKVRISPELAGKGRSFDITSNCSIPASIDFALRPSPLCTTLSKDGVNVRTVEHLLSALEATGVDNCRIRIDGLESDDSEVEVPILDGSARNWVDSIREVGLRMAVDEHGCSLERLAPHLNEPYHVRNDDAFVAAFPSPELRITYGIHFPQVSAIGSQWVSFSPFDDSLYVKEIASSRTFCLHEQVQMSLQVEQMRNAGLIKGGSLDNAIVCSASEGWINGPLRSPEEPCRHKVLDLIGDLSLYAQSGNQGLPVAHIVAYKASSFWGFLHVPCGGHALHTDFVRGLAESFVPD